MIEIFLPALTSALYSSYSSTKNNPDCLSNLIVLPACGMPAAPILAIVAVIEIAMIWPMERVIFLTWNPIPKFTLIGLESMKWIAKPVKWRLQQQLHIMLFHPCWLLPQWEGQSCNNKSQLTKYLWEEWIFNCCFLSWRRRNKIIILLMAWLIIDKSNSYIHFMI